MQSMGVVRSADSCQAIVSRVAARRVKVWKLGYGLDRNGPPDGLHPVFGAGVAGLSLAARLMAYQVQILTVRE